MVKEIKTTKATLYQCEECGLYYRNREKADECQAWCSVHKSCHLEIIKDALSMEEMKAVGVTLWRPTID